MDKLKAIFNSDEFNLLKVELTENLKTKEEHQRLIDSFKEISDFYEKNDRLPRAEEIKEFKLLSRLESIKKSPSKVKMLLEFDFYNLLDTTNTKSVGPLEIIQNDPLNILDDSEEDLSVYEMKNVPTSHRIRPEFMSRRNVCQNFSDYEDIFNLIHSDLEKRKRRLIKFDLETIREGNFYVLNGVLLLLEKLSNKKKQHKYETGDRERIDGRTKCVFDNGTESNMLYRSLIKALQLDGFGVSEPIHNYKEKEIEESDQEHGFIYIAKSKSKQHPQIISNPNIHKIGYTGADVSKRVSNARNEPTYLMADVQIISTFRCYNLNERTLEDKVQAFFDDVRLDINIVDLDGNQHKPREWFEVSIDVIEDAINLIVNDDIENYYYDVTEEQIIMK